MYGGSLFHALEIVFPEMEWHMYKFDEVPVGYWNDEKNQREYFYWIAQELKLQKPTDWYKVKYSDLPKGGKNLLTYVYGTSIIKALSNVYREYQWYPCRFENFQAVFGTI